MNEGVLVALSKRSPDFGRYKVVILDEAHERAAETDVLMALLSKAQEMRKGSVLGDLKVVVMAATLDVAKFCAYMPGASLLQVPGAASQIPQPAHKVGTDQFICIQYTT